LKLILINNEIRIEKRNKRKMDREDYKMKIKKCTFCQKLDNLKMECKVKEKNFMEINKNTIGEKKKENSKVEYLGENN